MSKGKFIVAVAALTLLSGLALAQSWTFMVTLEPEVGASHNLTMAVTAGATDGYDDYLDVPYFTPPDGKGAFFPLDDPVHPAYTKLSTDARGIETTDYTYWVMRTEGYYGLDPRIAVWVIDDLPDSTVGFFHIGSKLVSHSVDSVSDWVDMATADTFEFGPGEDAVVRFTPIDMVDEEPPYICGFIPVNGASGVENDVNINFDIYDNIRGVDLSAVDFTLWYDTGDTIEDAVDLISWTPLVGGYRATLAPPDGYWPDTTGIFYSVSACDLATPPNCMGSDSVIGFTTTEVPPGYRPAVFREPQPAGGCD